MTRWDSEFPITYYAFQIINALCHASKICSNTYLSECMLWTRVMIVRNNFKLNFLNAKTCLETSLNLCFDLDSLIFKVFLYLFKISPHMAYICKHWIFIPLNSGIQTMLQKKTRTADFICSWKMNYPTWIWMFIEIKWEH